MATRWNQRKKLERSKRRNDLHWIVAPNEPRYTLVLQREIELTYSVQIGVSHANADSIAIFFLLAPIDVTYDCLHNIFQHVR